MVEKKKILTGVLFFSLIFFFYSYSGEVNSIYLLPKQKEGKIKKALFLKQYIYDLESLNDILKELYSSEEFKFATKSAEMLVKNLRSPYTVEYIEHFLQVLNGEDGNSGYIAYIKYIYQNLYLMYIYDIDTDKLLTRNFDFIQNKIDKNLQRLSINLKNEDNIRPELKSIFQDLMIALNEIKEETEKLKNQHMIKPFNRYIDKKFNLPTNWAQYGSTLDEIIDFILNGDKKNKIQGIMLYYYKVYRDDTKPLQIYR